MTGRFLALDYAPTVIKRGVQAADPVNAWI